MQSFINKKKQKQNNIYFLILGWLGFFFNYYYKKIRAFKVVVLKFLAFITSLYNTLNIKCFIFYHFI